MKVLFSLFLILLFPISCLTSQNQLMQQAIESYNAGNYDGAIQNYEQLLQEGQFSTELFYNLGNCYFRNEDLGKAILNYERALLLESGDEDIQHNLEVAQNRIEQPLEKINEFFLIQWKDNLQNAASGWTWAIIGLILLWLGAAGWILWLLGQERKQKIIGFSAGIGLVLLSIIPFSLAFGRINQQKHSQKAIILQSNTAMKSAPDNNSETLQPLFAGYKVKLMDQIGDWYKVKLSDGNIGWVETGKVEEIRLEL